MTKTLAEIERVISCCRFEPWVISVKLDGARPYLQVSDPHGVCNVTGERKPWSGRKWLLSYHMTDTELVKTALKAVLSAVEHEALEKFTFLGVTIFDPHLSLKALVAARASYALDSREGWPEPAATVPEGALT